MIQKIARDLGRFQKIVRGSIKQNLRKHLANGEMIGKRGKDYVSIPLPQLDVPRFKYGKNGRGGVSSGPGEPGQAVSPQEGDDAGQQAGADPGEHMIEVDVPLADIAQIMAEELELPRLLPRGNPKLVHAKDKYTGVAPTGPQSLRHFKRTYKQALRRQLSAGAYNPAEPRIVPIRADGRFRSGKPVDVPQACAVAIYMMDVSGSMGDEQKEIVRIESFWIDAYLKSQYPGLVSRYIVHDAEAKVVDHDTFFRTKESGGTRISSAYECAAALIAKEHPPADWNIYPFHFTDGDNWADDDELAAAALAEKLLPAANHFCYAQVRSPYGTGRFIEVLRARFPAAVNLALSEIAGREAILASIKELLGKAA